MVEGNNAADKQVRDYEVAVQKTIAETKKRDETQTTADSEAAKEAAVKNEANKQPDARAIQGSSARVCEQYTADVAHAFTPSSIDTD